MEIAGFIVAVLAFAAAVASALYARGANRRADSANQTAREALDLQARIDARDREFRNVEWTGSYDLDSAERPVFRLVNAGHTDARSVSLILAAPGKAEKLYPLGDIDAQNSADVVLEAEPKEREIVELMLLTDGPWRVHWSSPLGFAEEFQYVGSQIF